MKIVFGLLSALFALFAIFQWNDPDSFWWILIYVDVAVLFGLAAAGKFYRLLTLVMGLHFLLIALVHLPGAFEFLTNQDGVKFSEGMQNTYPYIEKAREFGGALMTTIATGWLYTQTNKQA